MFKRSILTLTLAIMTAVVCAQNHEKPVDPVGAVALSGRAYELYQKKQFSESARLYRRAVDLGIKSPGEIYNAACVLALAGDVQSAFVYLDRAITAGYRNPGNMKVDTDLTTLHEDPRWPVMLQRAAGNQQRWLEQHRDPEKVALITSDVPAFWRVFDQLDRVKEPEALINIEYFDKGTVGLQDFVASRIGSAEDLLETVRSHRNYYASARQSTLQIKTMEPQIRASFRRFKELYPDAIFPDTYFVIGRLNSGGTTSQNGLLIGAEMHARTAITPLDEMSEWLKGVVDPVEEIPRIVCHELIHVQQKHSGKKLLDWTINEGSADFVGEIIWGGKLDMPYMRYGHAHEAELWQEFQRAMNGTDRTGWLYGGQFATNRVADLGYFIGYRISQAYYEQAKDKKQAIADILNVSDFDALLKASDYNEQWIAKHPSPGAAAPN